MSAFSAILPVVAVILTGYGARRWKLVPEALWAGVETLAFRVLMPALLVGAIARADLSWARVGSFGAALLLTLAVAALALWGLRRAVPLAALPNPRFTSLFQSVTRWNAFIALAMAGQMAGAEGATVISVAMAFLIAPVNVINVLVLTAFGSGRADARTIVLGVAKNPLVQGAALGVLFNLTGMPQPLAEAFDMVGKGAVGVSLLAVGAGIEFRRLLDLSPTIWAGVAARLIAMPALFLAVAHLFDLSALQMLAGVLAFGGPTAANGYVVAKAMGGDAPLYADLLTWHTVLSPLTLPLMLLAAQSL